MKKALNNRNHYSSYHVDTFQSTCWLEFPRENEILDRTKLYIYPRKSSDIYLFLEKFVTAGINFYVTINLISKPQKLLTAL